MPRDGSGNYTLPYPAVVDGTTIESAVHNGTMSDIALQLNGPLPIIAGGTGANSALGARANIDAEVAGQVVTNYDSHVWENGSFYSAGGATGEPLPGHGHVGTYQAYDSGSGFAIIQCRDVNDPGGPLYYKTKSSGVWEAGWRTTYGQTETDARYVNVTGDNMTGNLVIGNTGPVLHLFKTTQPASSSVFGSYNGSLRWQIELGNGTPESGANAGSNFLINYFNDAGAMIGTAFSIDRATGNASFSGTLTVNNQFFTNSIITTANSPTTGAVYFGSSGTKHIAYDGSNFVLTGGPVFTADIFATGVVYSRPTATTGTYQFGSSGTKYLTYDSVKFIFAGGQVVFPGFTNPGTGRFQMGGAGGAGAYYDTSAGVDRFWVGSDGAADIFRIYGVGGGNIMTMSPLGVATTFTGTLTYNGWYSRAGFGGAGSASATHIPYIGGAFQAWADATNFGNFTISSDYRIKKDVIELPGMWDTVKALRPIKYTQAQFSPPSHVEYVKEQVAKAAERGQTEQKQIDKTDPSTVIIPGPLFEADDIERWGFIAHELQETLTPSAASGVKDATDTIQSPNPFTVIAALTKALQEAMTRIEALEAR